MMKPNRTTVAVGLTALMIAAGAAFPGRADAAGSQSLTEDGTFTVPAGITEVTMTVVGAPGGVCPSGAYPGYGAIVDAVLSVTPGETLAIRVGGQGGTGSNSAGGANGGGTGGSTGSGGGGATDVRRGGTGLGDRVLVAGGGGGCFNNGGIYGGHGGQPIGADGQGGNAGGKGGTQSAGGAAGLYDDPGFGINGQPGTFGQGGDGYCCEYPGGGGGGGGGWYGGGGGAYSHSGGGGGSSYAAEAASDVVHSRALNLSEVPRVDISWDDPPATTTTTTTVAPSSTTIAPSTTTIAPTTTTGPTGTAPTAGFGESEAPTTTGTQGGSVVISGRDWRPGSEVVVSAAGSASPLCSLVANDDGRIAGSCEIPSSLDVGWNELLLEGTGADGQPATAVLGLTVTTPSASPTTPSASPSSLAFTG